MQQLGERWYPEPSRETRSVDIERTHRILYGIHPVAEALRVPGRVLSLHLEHDSRNPALRRLEHAARRAGVVAQACDRAQLFRLCQSPHHQGVVAEAAALANGSLKGMLEDRPDQPHTVLLVDRVQDPQNLGNLYRSADAAGVSLVFLPAKGAASHQLGSVARASAGAVEHVPTVVVGNLKRPLEELTAAGFRVFGLDPRGERSVWEADFPLRTAILVGAEGPGLGAPARAACHEVLRIPMRGKVDSLNVTNATAIVLFEVQRRRP
ncbi:MAG: RNA methyltransferase [Candidatus Riflebacteria bacterium]|nr:RNA methyltransferase [Candidatus Riflebacteria bacterium]